MNKYAGFAIHAARAASKARRVSPVPVVVITPTAPPEYLLMSGGSFL